MVLFVRAAHALQNLDGLLDARLIHAHRLEATLQRGVALDVLAVLVQRGSTYRLQLATGKRRLQDVRGVHRALSRTRADEHVHLIDEQDAVLRGANLLDDLLEALLKLAAVLRTSDQRADVERQHALPDQRVRDVARDDAVREALSNGGLADAGLTDQHRVVLGAPREDLDDALDLAFAPDHRVELPRPS